MSILKMSNRGLRPITQPNAATEQKRAKVPKERKKILCYDCKKGKHQECVSKNCICPCNKI